MKRRRPIRSGFTLLEVMIATGIFMIVMVVAIGIFTVNVGSSSTTEQQRINTQAARFAFESITREIRLAHGLTYVNNEVPTMVIPPFEIVNDEEGLPRQIRVYKVKKTGVNEAGVALYSLSRKSYLLSSDKELTLLDEAAYDNNPEAPQTAEQLFTAATTVDNITGQPVGPDGLLWHSTSGAQSLLANNLIADQFSIRRFSAYPATGAALEGASGLSVQPFIQIDLTVLNERYNENRDANKQVKTTLRTMIVPRNFVSAYEVVQPGVQGATE